MSHRPAILLFTAFIVASIGCDHSRKSPLEPVVEEAYISVPGAVSFDIEPFASDDGSLELKATYTSQGKTAKFIVALAPAKAIEDKDLKDFPAKVGQGKFVAEAGSDASVLLTDLKKALEAKVLPTNPKRTNVLPFTFVDIGDNLSQASNGGFNVKPRGHWTAIKIFIGEGEQESQVFVNYNLAIKKGQFSIKDPDYGDLVLSELAKVL
jgi:hypothetical protein